MRLARVVPLTASLPTRTVLFQLTRRNPPFLSAGKDMISPSSSAHFRFLPTRSNVARLSFDPVMCQLKGILHTAAFLLCSVRALDVFLLPKEGGA